MFDERTCQALRWYVYMLVNPKTGQPFYVGKGENNRVFQHVENVREGKSKSEPKNEIIKNRWVFVIRENNLSVIAIFVYNGKFLYLCENK